MARIRWRKKDIIEFEKMRKFHNAKITRLEQEGVDPSLIPDRFYKDQIVTRDDFNKFKKRVQDFKAHDSMEMVQYKGQEVTKFQKKQYQRMTQSINARRRHLSSLRSYEGATMGTIEDISIQPINLDRDRSAKEWELFTKSLENQYFSTQLEKYKENYIKALRNELGAYADEIIVLVEKADPKVMLEAQYMDELNSIPFIYDGNITASLRVETIYNKWDELIN